MTRRHPEIAGRFRDYRADDASEVLATLGNDPHTVAGRLQLLGITGEGLNSRTCPLARFLNGFGIGCECRVHQGGVEVTGADGYVSHEVHRQTAFVDAFDDGVYPFLEPQFDPGDLDLVPGGTS
ncbi:MAG: hypothetical protein AAFZ07_20295 [Actinomycetota bacterium]